MELQWKVTNVIRETKDTNTYVLRPLREKVSYEAGQFLTFIFQHRHYEIRRSYSFSSTPGVDAFHSVTVKEKKNGEISRYIFNNWKPGTIVNSIEPAGIFTIDTDAQATNHYFFIAAGSGITPCFSLLKKVLYSEPLSTVTLIYQNHTESTIIFDKALQQLEKQFAGRFTRIDLLSKPQYINNKPQRLNNALLERLLTANCQLSTANFFYTCGPDLFMRMVQFTVRVMGFSAEQVRKENFTIDSLQAPAFTLDSTPRHVTVQYGNKLQHFNSAYPDTILQAALQHHISLPYSCRAGKCSACVARCLKGTVKMSRNEVLTDKDLREGYVLTCVGYAETDVELKF